MNKLFVLFALLTVSVLFLSACSSTPQDSDSTIDDVVDDSTNQKESADESVKTTAMMKHCTSNAGEGMPEYEYYISSDIIFENITTSNQGWSAKITSREEVCVNVKSSEVEGWLCSDPHVSFGEYSGIVDQMVSSPVADVNSITCEEVEFDPAVFEH
ncbi:MAG: hypothetical protein ACQESC_02880 [Nanobdellota archaeon]